MQTPSKGKTHEQKCSLRYSNINLKKSRHCATINSHPLNKKVTAFAVGEIPQENDSNPRKEFLSDFFDNKSYYHCDSNFHKLIENKEFYDDIFRKRLIAVSKSKLDVDNAFCLQEDGILWLSVDKETYQTIGLVGQKSTFKHQKNSKFIIKFCLSIQKEFEFGKKMFNRLKFALKRIFSKTEFYCFFEKTWQDPKIPEIITNSLKYCKYRARNFLNPKAGSYLKRIYAPEINENFVEKLIKNDDFLDKFLEWIGLVNFSANFDIPSATEKIIENKIKTGKNGKKLMVTNFKRIEGLISSNSILLIFNDLVKKTQNIKFSVLTVEGFEDAISAWKFREHGYFENGDNGYTFVIFPDGNYLQFVYLAAMDFNFQ